MLIIVDGPDCSGKTTLVDRLAQTLRVTAPQDETVVYHRGPPRGHPLAEYVEPLLGYRPGQGMHVVCDRWHWGEAVYPRLYDRPTRMDDAVWLYTEMFLRSRGALVVYPDVDAVTLRQRLLDRGDDVFTQDKIAHASTAFRYTAARTDLPVVRFRSLLSTHVDRDADLDLQGVVNRAVVNARERETLATPLNRFHTYVGPARPDYLLVGDERPPRMDRDHPAFMPYAPRSGHFLLSALTGHRVHSLGIVNANDVDDVAEAWDVLGGPAGVVALGAGAHRGLRRTGIRYSRVPHPQFVRRFYQRHRDEYGAAIAGALATRQDLSGWRPANPSWRPR